jgi:two-component system phosphate regulon sensor histidine kinase PhoR
MNSAWSKELLRIFFVMVSTLAFGFSSGYWLFSVIFHFLLYIVWIMAQLRSFERWIRNGAHSKNAPDTSGIWELIVQHIYRTQKKNIDRKKSLSGLAKRYQAMMKALPDATIVLNENFEIDWANQVAEEILGIDISHDTGHRIDNIIRDVLIQELLNGTSLKSSVVMVSPVDQQKTLVLTKVEYGDNQTLLTARDITQRLALQKMRKAFIANASHELRTPLTVISGYLEMLNGDENLPLSVNKMIFNAYKQANRMDQILDDLLTLSKLEEKSVAVSLDDLINVPELIQKLVADFSKTTGKDTHEINVNIDEKLKIRATDVEFFSVCQNLLSNAIKYSPKGSLINVCWCLAEDGAACLQVTDNGEGIALEHLSRLTERFYRINLNRSRDVVGTGLGLSIVKHIMENHGGYLDIQSELNIGSTFTAHFPSSRVFTD